MSNVQIIADKIERLKLTHAYLHKQWKIHHDKLAYLSQKAAIEAGAAIEFQLDNQIKTEAAQLAEVEEKLQKVEDELAQLESTITQAKQLDRARAIGQALHLRETLYKVLLGLDYVEHVRVFRSFLKHQPCVFIIHGSSEYTEQSLQLLLKRLLGFVKGRLESPTVRLKLSCRVRRRNVEGLWRELGREFGLEYDASPNKIAEEVCRRSQQENVILVFDDLDRIYDISEFVRDFWCPLVERAKHLADSANPCQLLMFLLDYSGNISSADLSCVEQFDSTWESRTPIRLPVISQFSGDVLSTWIEPLVEDLPDELVYLENYVEFTVNQILEGSNNGIPDLVIEQICKLWGCNLHDEETHRWLAS